ncbi:hypothetical protein WJX73_010540, partial [Symbiochloris irregularis]
GIGGTPMPVRQFLTYMAHVVQRDPDVFLQAVKATCVMEEHPGRVPMLSARKKTAPPADSGAAQQRPQDPARPAATPAPTQPGVPASLAGRLSLGGSAAPAGGQPRTPGASVPKTPSLQLAREKARPRQRATAMDTDATPSGAPPSTPGGAQMHVAMGVGPSAANGAAQQPGGTTAASTQPVQLTSIDHATLMQCVALKMLTDFTLMYGNCVGILLKRDAAESSFRDSGTSSRGAATPVRHTQAGPGHLFRHVMHTHLTLSVESEWVMHSLREPASFFLLSVCIRSAEGRRRITGEIVSTLSYHSEASASRLSKDAGDALSPSASELASTPFKAKPGWPSPCKVKTFVELIGSLLSASSNSGTLSRGPRPGAGPSLEMARAMKEGGVVKALTDALALMDLDHPKAVRVIGSILKPLEAPMLQQGRPSVALGLLAVVETSRCRILLGLEPRMLTWHAFPTEELEGHFHTSDSDEDHSMGMSHEGDSSGHDHDEDDDDEDDEDDEDDDEEDEHDHEDEDDDEDDEMGYPHEDGPPHGMGHLVGVHTSDEEDDEEEESDDDEHEMHAAGEDPLGLAVEEGGLEDGDAGADAEQMLGMDPRLAMELQDEGDDGEEDEEDPDDEDGVEDEQETDEEDGDSWRFDHQEEDMEDMEDGAAEPANFDDWAVPPLAAGGPRGAGAFTHHHFNGGPAHAPVPMMSLPNSTQHSLLQRPVAPLAGATVQVGIRGADTNAVQAALNQLSTEAMRAGLRPGQNGPEFVLPIDPSRIPGLQQQAGAFMAGGPRGMGGGGIDASSALQMSLETIMNNLAAPPPRPEPRVASNWGAVPLHRASNADLQLATQLEQPLVGALRQLIPAPEPAADAGASAQQQQAPVPAAAAGTAAEAGATPAPASAPAVQPPQQTEAAEGDAQQTGQQDHDMEGPAAPQEVAQPAASEQQQAAPQAAAEPVQAPVAPSAPADGNAMSEDAVAAAFANAMAAIAHPDPTTQAAQQDPAALAAALADEDVDMADAQEDAATVASRGDQDMSAAASEQGDDEPASEPVDPHLASLAEAAGIELAFLDALPPELRLEVLAAHGVSLASLQQATAAPQQQQQQPQQPQQPQSQPPPAPTPAPSAAAATDADTVGEEGGHVESRGPTTGAEGQGGDAQSAAAAAPAEPTASSAVEAPAGPSQPAEAVADEMEGIDPEFIAALPPDIQAEVLEQQRRECRRRQAAQQREAARQQAAAASGGANVAAAAADMDMATVLATFPPDLREEVLANADEEMLSSFSPALLAEAQAIRDRAHHRMHRDAMVGRRVGARVLASGAHEPLAPFPPSGSRLAAIGETWPGLAMGGPSGRGAGMAVPPTMGGGPLGAGGLSSELDTAPQVDETALLNLLAILKLPVQISKGALPRLFLNLSFSTDTSAALLRIMLGLLRDALATGDDNGGPNVSRDADRMEEESGVRRLEDALLQTEPSSSTAAPGSSQQPSATSCLLPKEPLSAYMSRRLLELFCTLARHHLRLASEAVCLQVPQKQSVPSAPVDRKGKSKAREPVETGSVGKEHGLEVVLQLLGTGLCRRSNAHLEQALHLLDVLLQSSKLHAQMLLGEIPPGTRPGHGIIQTARRSTGPPGGPATEPRDDMQFQFGALLTRRPPRNPAGADPTTSGRAISSALQAQRNAVVEVLSNLQEPLVGQLPALLGRQGLSETAYTRVSTIMRLLVEAAPKHKLLLLRCLQEELSRLSESAEGELRRLAATDPASSGTIVTGAGMLGGLILRMLQSVRVLVRLGMPKQPSLHGAPPVAQGSLEPEDAAALDSIAQQTGALWQALSEVIAAIEAAIPAPVPGQGEGASRVLPPGAASVLPLVEAFFVLAGTRVAHLPPPENLPSLSTRPSAILADLSRESSVPMELAGAEPTPTPSRAASVAASIDVAQDRAALDVHLTFLRFAERHRQLVNMLLRHNSALLQGSLAPLLRMPRLIDFDNKRNFFRSRVRAASNEDRHYNTLRIHVRRDHVFEDSFHQLRLRLPEEMRAKLSVHFQGEEGIDAGGVSREWYQVMAREMFNPNFSLFVPTPEGGTTFQPNPNSVVQNDEQRGTNHLDFFKFVGRVVGKALHDGQFIDAYFTRSFYKHMLGQPLTYQDIEAVDPDFYKNLRWMLENDITDVLDLTFTEETDYFGRKQLVELKPDGANLRVTDANKREYVNLVAQHRMTTVIRAQINSFLTGFWDLVPKDLISMFNDHELELLISGLPEIDVGDLRANTEYAGYSAASRVVQWFWEVVGELDKEDLALLVQFVTGTSKVPLDGFKALQGISGPQKFQIHKSYGPSDRLPSAHTCFNQLDLIEYDTKENLRERLLMALHEGSVGFGFG